MDAIRQAVEIDRLQKTILERWPGEQGETMIEQAARLARGTTFSLIEALNWTLTDAQDAETTAEFTNLAKRNQG